MYFTQDHEDAIVRYCKSECSQEKTELYVKWIQPAFDELVDKIVFTYKFTTLPNIDELREDCKIWLTTILAKYDPNKGSKAFSYFSVITKNWFIHKVKQTTKKAKREVDYEDALKEIEETELITHMTYVEDRVRDEFWQHLWAEIESWSSLPMRDNERKVYEAVKVVLEAREEIQIFNKKAIYLYLRELTGMNTKQIVSQLNKMRKRYRDFKREWDDS